MNPHPSLSLALMAEFDRERTRIARPGRRRLPRPRLRAARSRRAARAAAACC